MSGLEAVFYLMVLSMVYNSDTGYLVELSIMETALYTAGMHFPIPANDQVGNLAANYSRE